MTEVSVQETSTTVIFPISAAIAEGTEFAELEEVWETGEPGDQYDQHRFLVYHSEIRDLVRGIKEVVAMATYSLEALHKYLDDNGYPDIRLEDAGPNAFYIAAILDILFKWKIAGDKVDLASYSNNVTVGKYLAVHMDEDGCAKVLVLPDGSSVVEIPTEDGDTVYLTKHSKPLFGFETLEEIERLQSLILTSNQFHPEYDGAVFPMVEVDQMVDVSWIHGLNTRELGNGRLAKILEAKQKTLIRWNHKYGQAKSVFVASVLFESYTPPPKPPFVIDEPFIAWMVRDGISVPVWSGWFNTDSWNDPGDFAE